MKGLANTCSIIQPVLSTQQLTNIYLGHIHEYHYVSTLLCFSLSSLDCHNELNSPQVLNTSSIVDRCINQSISNTNETMNPDQSTQSSQSKQEKREYMREYRRKQARNSSQPSTKSTEATKQKNRKYMKEYRKHKQANNNSKPLPQSPDTIKQKKKQYAKEYRKQKKASKSFQPLTQTPEANVKQKCTQSEPLYICTCCDQLWYRHSVVPAATLKENNPDVQKRLLNRKSVDNIEKSVDKKC